MSADGEDSGPGRREVAHRLFAAEFDDATVSYSESDEERAPKYVVTPTGARVNRLFAVGVLTEVESVNEDVLRARVVDPTGAFVSYAGQYQPDAAAFFERATPPTFVALTGKARTFEPDDGDRIYTSVRPESVAEVDAETRDRWTVSAAEATLRRVAVMTDARETGLRGEDLYAELRGRGHDESLARGVAVALDRYGTTPAYLDAVRRLALDALEVVAGDREEVRPLDAVPDEGGEASVGPVPESVRVAAGDASATAEETQTDEPPAEETQTD
ncbi:MAG: RPA family protein, partial [Haloplanus sp.]